MNIITRFATYLRNAQAELQKVAWPTKQDVSRYTTLIVAVTVVSAVFFAALDGGLNNAVTSLISRRYSATPNQANQTIPEASLQQNPVEVETVTSSNPISGTETGTNPITNQ